MTCTVICRPGSPDNSEDRASASGALATANSSLLVVRAEWPSISTKLGGPAGSAGAGFFL